MVTVVVAGALLVLKLLLSLDVVSTAMAVLVVDTAVRRAVDEVLGADGEAVENIPVAVVETTGVAGLLEGAPVEASTTSVVVMVVVVAMAVVVVAVVVVVMVEAALVVVADVVVVVEVETTTVVGSGAHSRCGRTCLSTVLKSLTHAPCPSLPAICTLSLPCSLMVFKPKLSVSYSSISSMGTISVVLPTL